MKYTITLGLVAVFGLAAVARGQQPQNLPRVAYVYPAGGQQGTTVQVVVAGQFLDGVGDALVSGRGVRASVVNLDRPLNQRQITELRDQIQALQPKAAGDPAIRQQLAAMRTRLGDALKRNRNPVMSELVTLDVTIERGADPGLRQLRLRTPFGLSGPLHFAVGQLPEARERDVKTSVADAELTVTLPVTVNGRLIPGDVDNIRQPLRQPAQYMPGDVDRYRFSALRGQHVVTAVSARDLTPYLADAVPGWFQAVITLYDATGRDVAYCDDDRFRPDPVLHYQIPADGEYVVEIRDAIFRGREDFVYRVSIGELPFITSRFPLGGPSGAKTVVDVTGWNLPASRLTMDAARAAGVYPLSMRAGALESNRVPFAVGALPERLEQEPNNTPKQAQEVALPVVINGRIRETGDWDVFRFKGLKGDVVVAEVAARRLDSPLDSVLELTDATGTRLAFGDDREDRGAGLSTHHADAFVQATLPADGTFLVRLADVQRKGGDAYGYRLRIGEPMPDFELRVAPSGINAAGGANVPVTVTAIRKDGFAGDIALALKDAPAGFTIRGGVIPAGQDRIRITLTPPAVTTRDPVVVEVEGRAEIHGRTVVRMAVAADDRTQAFVYHHLVPADDLRVSVFGRGGTRVPVRVLGTPPLAIPAGGSVHVRATLPAMYQAFEHIQFELSEPPDGIRLGESSVGPGMAGFVVRSDGAKAAAGLRGNLIVIVSGERIPPASAQAPAARRRVPIGVLPAIAFEVIR